MSTGHRQDNGGWYPKWVRTRRIQALGDDANGVSVKAVLNADVALKLVLAL